MTSIRLSDLVSSIWTGTASASTAIWLGFLFPLAVSGLIFFTLAISVGRDSGLPAWGVRLLFALPFIPVALSGIVLWRCAFNQRLLLGGYLLRGFAVAAILFGLAGVGLAQFMPSKRSAAEKSNPDCLSKAELRAYYGNWAKKSIWDELNTNKNWGRIQRSGELIDAVMVTRQGDNHVSLAWHEGAEGCIQQRAGQLWARLNGPDGYTPTSWEGPFTFIGTDTDVAVAYFRKIFDHHCYRSDNGDKWCFDDGFVNINNQRSKATLLLDGSEVPEYGTPLAIEGMEGLYLFVPSGQGWKVFKDTWASDENRVPVEPNGSAPWRTLGPYSDLPTPTQ